MRERTGQFEDIESLISISADPSGAPAQRSEPHGIRPDRRRAKPPRNLDVALAGKPTPDDLALWRWAKQFIDRYDHSRAGAGKLQVSNALLERHLNSSPKDYAARLRALRRCDVQHYRQGRGAIHVKSRFDRSKPAVVIRIDPDAHQPGQTREDAAAFIDRLRREVPTLAALYDEATTRGHSAYAVVDIRPYDEINGKVLYPARWRINETIKQAGASLKTLSAAWRLNVDVELQGGFNIVKGEPGERRITHRTHPMKLPRCPREGDGQRLLASRFNDGVLNDIIRVGQSAVPQHAAPPSPSLVVRRAVRELDRRIRRTFAIVDPGSKHARRVQCVREAVGEILSPAQWDGTGVSTAQESAIIELADAKYQERGYNGGRRDAAREAAFRRIIRWLFDTFDSEAKGDGSKGGGLRFGHDDLDRADELARSMISQSTLDAINRDSKLKRCPLTYRHLATAICTAAKNTQMSNGAVPTKSIQGMLKWFGLATNGSQAAVIFSLLMRNGLLRMKHSAYGPGFCCKYEPAGQMWSLPFIAELKPVESDPALAAQANRYTQGSAGGQRLINVYSEEERETVFGSNDQDGSHAWALSDPAYAAVLDDLHAEYDERRLAP